MVVEKDFAVVVSLVNSECENNIILPCGLVLLMGGLGKVGGPTEKVVSLVNNKDMSLESLGKKINILILFY